MSHVYQRALIKLGESHVISLPRAWLDYYNIKTGDKVEIITNGRTAKITILPTEHNKDFEESEKYGCCETS